MDDRPHRTHVTPLGSTGVRDEEKAENSPELASPEPSVLPDETARPVNRIAVAMVVVVAIGVAVGHALWIVSHRRLGALDPDEAGYLATALRFQRSISLSHPIEFPHQVATAANGFVVPGLSLVPLILGHRSVQVAMLIQPVLMVALTLALFATIRRVAPDWVAAVASIVFIGTPTMIGATQSYWYGLGAATATAVAFWALFTSQRCANRRIWIFAAAVAVSLGTRTMMLGYLPAFALAAAIVAGANRERFRRAVLAMVGAVVAAAPFYIVNARAIFLYLFSYGYGKRAGEFGQGGPWERIGFRINQVLNALGFPLGALPTRIMIGTAVAAFVYRMVCTGRPRRIPYRVAAALAFVATGLAALASTTNNGVWFELPIVTVAVVALAAAVGAFPWPLRLVPLALTAAAATVQLQSGWWLVPVGTEGVPPIVVNRFQYAHYEPGFEQYDPRFSRYRRDEAPAAARQWWALSVDVHNELIAIRGPQEGRLTGWITGNFEMFNSNTVGLAGEVLGEPLYLFVPDTGLSAQERRQKLVERTKYRPHMLVFALHNQHLFTPDEQVKDFYRQARADGWVPVWRRLMPEGGRVEILMRQPNLSAVPLRDLDGGTVQAKG